MLQEMTGLRAAPGAELLTIRHAVNHNRITLVCLLGRHRGGNFRSDFYRQGCWVDVEDLHAYPFSAPQRRVALAISPLCEKKATATQRRV
jgi:hypothetical protein